MTPPEGSRDELVADAASEGMTAAEVAADPEAPLYSGIELETDDGPWTPRQMAVGIDNELGGGEWPDPRAPAVAPAPGAVDGPSPRAPDPDAHDPRTEPHGP